jgi:hypothetical protein
MRSKRTDTLARWAIPLSRKRWPEWLTTVAIVVLLLPIVDLLREQSPSPKAIAACFLARIKSRL